ncbi:MAG: DUF192 domain-containing protein [Patescibacteria group bacterium]
MSLTNNKIGDLFFLFLGLIIIVGSFILFFNKSIVKNNSLNTVNINGVVIQVEVASTPKTRTQGLSNRKTLLSGTGMLFVFEQPDQYGFWMKNMNFALDFIWINDQFEIIGIEKEVSPETFPQVFYPNQPIKYVLELPAGSSDMYNIDIGTVIQYNQ